jgi:phage-related baseplate assembly protein
VAIASDSFAGVDLSRLPASDIIEALDYDSLFASNLAQFQVYFPSFDATVESDPVFKIIELFTYRELILRQRVNDTAKAVMVAFAKGNDLDQLAALFEVERYVLTPADPVTGADAVLESDDDFRRRLVLAPEGYSVAGRKGPISITPLRRVQTCWMPRPTARHRTISRPRFWPCWRRTMSVPT